MWNWLFETFGTHNKKSKINNLELINLLWDWKYGCIENGKSEANSNFRGSFKKKTRGIHQKLFGRRMFSSQHLPPKKVLKNILKFNQNWLKFKENVSFCLI